MIRTRPDGVPSLSISLMTELPPLHRFLVDVRGVAHELVI